MSFTEDSVDESKFLVVSASIVRGIVASGKGRETCVSDADISSCGTKSVRLGVSEEFANCSAEDQLDRSLEQMVPIAKGVVSADG